MAGLARRLAPAAALGGLAIVIVGVADPALAGRGAAADASASGASTLTTSAAAPATTSDSTTSDSTTTDSTTTDSTTSDTATPEATTAATSCDTASAVTGPVVQTRWGPVQVAATIVDGQLCEVHAVAWPSGDGRSLMISQYAIPILDQQASSQGVQFDGVSGATYTTEGYRESLQQLLDSL